MCLTATVTSEATPQQLDAKVAALLLHASYWCSLMSPRVKERLPGHSLLNEVCRRGRPSMGLRSLPACVPPPWQPGRQLPSQERVAILHMCLHSHKSEPGSHCTDT